MEVSYGYHEDPRNGDGIVRARTTLGQLRSWKIPRTLKALNILYREFGKTDFPGLYILFHKTRKEVYVGEAKSLYNRLKTHTTTPEEKIKDWDHALVINDGRPATQSDFNDTVIRKSLEWHLIRLLKVNKYDVLSQGEQQRHNPQQKAIVERLLDELDFFLLKQGTVAKLIEKKKEELVLSDDLFKILKNKGHAISKWKAKEAIIDGRKVFIRPGSKKTKGWQITIRGKKTGSFIDSLQKGEGDLLIPRNGVLYIPLKEVQKIIDGEAYKQDTIDVWITFGEDKIEISYKDNVMDVTRFKVLD